MAERWTVTLEWEYVKMEDMRIHNCNHDRTEKHFNEVQVVLKFEIIFFYSIERNGGYFIYFYDNHFPVNEHEDLWQTALGARRLIRKIYWIQFQANKAGNGSMDWALGKGLASTGTQ